MPNFTLKHLKIFLFLVALHSLCVGLGLILVPSHFFVDFGYNYIGENFFRAQGGVFHFVMVVAYLLAAKNPIQNKIMVVFSIGAKAIATIFLFAYFFLFDSILVVFLSGVGDFAMGLVIYYLSNRNGLFDARRSSS